MVLSATDQGRIGSASSAAIETGLASVGTYLANHQRWLGSNNRYRTNPTLTIAKDIAAGGLTNKHVREYIAASAPLHTADGWSFLSRALQAHAVGDPDVSRHLAYYAELRAAMGLLATQGVGVFNARAHLVVDDAGKAHSLAYRGTHSAAWLYLEEWAKSPSAASLLADVLRPEGQPLAAWIGAIPGQVAWAPMGMDWLLALGLDLQRLAADRDARNEASYRPTSLKATQVLPSPDLALSIADFVTPLEPAVPGSYRTLDLHFLRISLETAFRAQQGRTCRQMPRAFQTMLESVVAEVLPGQQGHEHLVAFLRRGVVPADPPIISDARCDALPTHPRHNLQVMARAALLLRVASGSVVRAFEAADLSFDVASSWWAPLGVQRGLWDEAPHVDDLADQWLDVASAIEDIRDWAATEPNPTPRDFQSSCAGAVRQATTLESLALAGMAT